MLGHHPLPLVSVCVGAACLVAYAAPHRPLLFDPRRPASWLAPTVEHAGPFHLLFNLFWLYELAPGFEAAVSKQVGTLLGASAADAAAAVAVAFLYAAVALASNAAQYASTGPHFLGLSGVVFGLVGFLAVAAPQALYPGTVRFFAGWFVLCVALTAVGLFPVANAAHGAGAAAGALLGWLLGGGGATGSGRSQ